MSALRPSSPVSDVKAVLTNIQGVPFIVSPSTAVLSHDTRAPTGTSVAALCGDLSVRLSVTSYRRLNRLSRFSKALFRCYRTKIVVQFGW